MTFWKPFPPGWFAEDWAAGDVGDWDYGDGGGGGGGGDDDDGDGGRDHEADRERERDQEREEERDREREREREEERRRQEEEERRRREEEERQRRLEEQRRQIEEEQRRQQEEEERRRQEEEERNRAEDMDGDGVPDQGTLTDGSQSGDPGVENRLQEQFQNYEEQRQAQEQAFDPTNPGWIYQSQDTQNERRQAAVRDESPRPDPDRTPGFATQDREREFTPAIATLGPAYRAPGILASTPEPEPTREELKPPETRVPEIAATAAAQAAAATGASPLQIAQTAEHAARIASDQQTLANQSAWTRASFRSTYGDQAEAEWARQHEAELARNRSLYGASEPRAGQAPLANAPAGTAMAPDRRIGQVAPPVSGQTARYGINGPAPAGPAAPAVPPTSARVPPAGTVTPQAQGLPGFPGAGAPVINPQQQGFGTYPQPAPPPEPGPSRERGTLPEQPRTPVAAPSALPSGAPTAGEPGGPPLAPGPVLNSSGQTISDPRDYRPSPPAPPVDQQARDTDYRTPPDLSNELGQPGDPGYTGRPYDPNEGMPQTPEDVRRIQNAIDTYGDVPFAQREIPMGSRFTPTRNIVDYDPATGQTRERNYGIETYASTDTAVPSPAATAASAPHADPVLAAISTTRPLDTLATLAATSRGPDYDPRQDAAHIANGISAMLRGDRDAVWAEPYLNDVARIAWAREERQNGRNSDPRNTPVEYVEQWKDAFYGNGTEGDARVPMVKELQQEMIDHAAARMPAGKPFRWQDVYGETGEKGPAGSLISRQVTDADCGPNAFSTILRSRGYNADPAQTYQYARTNGGSTGVRYHNGSEFTGPQNYARMLREEAGLDVETVPVDMQGTNWNRIDQELAEGRPVTLSSPGHYWVISAKDPNTGKYYAGATTLRGNPEWMPKGGFVYNGAANTAIFARGDVNPTSRAVQTLGLKPPQTGVGNTRPLLSGKTEYQGGPPPSRGQQATQRLSQEMSTAPPSGGGSAAAAGPSPQANLKPRFTVEETTQMRNRILNEMPDIQFAPNDDMDTRLTKMAPALSWLEREYGFSAEALAGMAVNESGVGTAANAPAGKANNLWSTEYMPSDSQATGPIPQGRWAAYPSVKAALARFVGMYAHPENGYRYTWQDRQDPDKLLDALVKDKYIVDEPGYPIGNWYRGVNAGRERYRRVTGGKR